MRPSSSASVPSRPSTSQSQYRPVSRFSHRSGSQLSHRPSSQLSHRPSSRLSQRPPSRHALRFTAQLQGLVNQVTGLDVGDDEDYIDACDNAARTLEANRYTGLAPDIREVDTKVDGLIEKARIKGHDTLATGLMETRQALKDAVQNPDMEDRLIKESLLPSHIHLLLLLAKPSTSSTHEAAAAILYRMHNPEVPPPPLTWADILAEEPFEGEHWLMNPSPTSSVSSDRWSDLRRQRPDSVQSHSLGESDCSSQASASSPVDGENLLDEEQVQEDARRALVEELRERQYWTSAWQMHGDVDRPFELGDPSTLGPSIVSIQQSKDPLLLVNRITYFPEVDAVREVLMTLQGTASCLFSSVGHAVEVADSGPRLTHMSIGAFHSILKSFAETSSTLATLRSFVASAYGQLTNPEGSKTDHYRTFFAFVEGIEGLLNDFGLWCSGREERICRAQGGEGPPETVTLLSLKRDIEAQTSSTFAVLRTIVQTILPSSTAALFDFTKVNPSWLSKTILDELLQHSQSHLCMGDAATASTLTRVFVHAVAPLWNTVRLWIKVGVPVEEPESTTYHPIPDLITDREFFIQVIGGISDTSESWGVAAVLRTQPLKNHSGVSRDEVLVPKFLESAGASLLSAGKAIGLLRALGVDDFFHPQDGKEWVDEWVTCETLFSSKPRDDDTSPTVPATPVQGLTVPTSARLELQAIDKRLSEASTEALAFSASEYLAPFCQAAQARLNLLLGEDCRLWDRLECMQDVYLMGRGDIMTHFCDVLFSRMDAKKAWTDYHFLNGAFRDVVATSSCHWIEAESIRLAFRGSSEMSVSRTVRALEGLVVEYNVPFPLNYIFGRSSARLYSSIFVFLLQLRRAKTIIDGLLMKGLITLSVHIRAEELKAFYALRGKLSWIVGTLMSYVMTYVLHVEVLRVHQALHAASSLDEMIDIHRQHLDTILTQCFLTSQHALLHRSVLAILDLCLAFNDTFSAFTSDTSVDISRHSLIMLRDRRRSIGEPRRKQRLRQSQRRLRRNVIGFASDVAAISSDDSDSSDDADFSHIVDEVEAGADQMISFVEESFLTRIENMSITLDDLVRFIHRSVEDLGSGSSDSAFSILSFMLEDWDR